MLRLLAFRTRNGRVPFSEWMQDLKRKDEHAYVRCKERVDSLQALGHRLRRPHADTLRDGIHELRANLGRARYRILYFFSGTEAVVLSHAIIKKSGRVPDREIQRAVRRRKEYLADPETHSTEVDSDWVRPEQWT